MKEYIKPTINIQQAVVEQLLAGSNENGQMGGPGNPGDAKRNDFWADEDESNEAFSISDVWD